MKPKRAKKKTASGRSGPAAADSNTRTVTFEFRDSDAKEVCLAGSFNEWHPSASPMVPLGSGRWVKEMVLASGVYEYLFVVDGRWLPDPGAAVTVPNPFGGVNCCVKVE